MDNDFVITYNITCNNLNHSSHGSILRYTPVFQTPHRPVYIEVCSPLGATDEPRNCIHDALLLLTEKHYLPYLPCGDRDDSLAPHGLLSLRNIPTPTFSGLPSSLSTFISQSISLLI